MKDPLTQTFLFHADNIFMTNTKNKTKSKHIFCMFVPGAAKKMRIHTVELEDDAYDN